MTRFAVATSHYGGQTLAYARLHAEMEDAKIRHRSIRGCPYPEMTRAEQVREFMLSDLDVLVFVDGNVDVKLDGIGTLADVAVESGIALPFDDQENVSWSHALELCAVSRGTLEAMLAAEERRYGNSAVEMVFNAERTKACPLASPWERNGSALVSGEWLTESEAFLVRATRAKARVRRELTGAKVARRKIQTSVSNADVPMTGEPGSRFAVCIPSFGALDVDQTDRVRKLERLGMMVIRIHDCPWIDLSRSWLAETALSHGRGVFFLDHDIIFAPNDVLRLCQQALERDAVVAGAYSMRGAGKNVIGALDVLPGPLTFFTGGETFPAHYSGLGFAAIPPSVLDGMDLPKLHTPVVSRRLRPWFGLRCDDGFYAGEDVSFCARVHDLSIETVEREGEIEWIPTHSGRKNCRVFIDTRVRLAHRGQYDYGIEDAGCVVPRCDSLETHLLSSRGEARDALKNAMELPVEARLDMIEGYSQTAERRDDEKPGFEAI